MENRGKILGPQNLKVLKICVKSKKNLAKKIIALSVSKALPKKDASKMEKHVFRVYDTNADGFIDFVEFMVSFIIEFVFSRDLILLWGQVVYYVMADGTPEEVLLKIFRIFDINRSEINRHQEIYFEKSKAACETWQKYSGESSHIIISLYGISYFMHDKLFFLQKISTNHTSLLDRIKRSKVC